MKKTDYWWALLAFISLAVWCLGVFTAQQAERQTHSISARWLDGGVSPVSLTRQEDYFRQDGMKDMPETTLWKEIPSQDLSDSRNNTAKSVVTVLFGYIEDICQNDVITGGFPTKGDTEGCVISQKTAFDLWGSCDVLGKTIRWNETDYFVYGVVKGSDSLMIVQTDGGSTETFPNMQLRFSDGGSQEEAEIYLNKAGFMGAQILDLPLIGWMLQLFCFVPVVLLGISIIVKLLCQGIKLLAFPKFLITYMPPAIVFGAACVILLGGMITIPARLIPGNWSDFEFYGKLFEKYAGNIKTWLFFPSARDIVLVSSVLLTIFIILVTVSLMTAPISRIKIRSIHDFLIGCFGSVGVMFGMAIIFAGHGGVAITKSMWLMPCLWIITDYALGLYRLYLSPKGEREDSYEGENQVI